MSENLAFTDRVIRKAQSMGSGSLFARVLTDYLFRQGRLSLERDLIWVQPPSSSAQVAVWLIGSGGRA